MLASFSLTVDPTSTKIWVVFLPQLNGLNYINYFPKAISHIDFLNWSERGSLKTCMLQMTSYITGKPRNSGICKTGVLGRVGIFLLGGWSNTGLLRSLMDAQVIEVDLKIIEPCTLNCILLIYILKKFKNWRGSVVICCPELSVGYTVPLRDNPTHSPSPPLPS